MNPNLIIFFSAAIPMFILVCYGAYLDWKYREGI